MSVATRKPESLWTDSFKRLKKNKASMFSFYFIVATCFVALFAQFLAPFSFEEQFIDKLLQPPNSTHYFGTDGLGRDLYSRMIYGARMSMSVAILTAIISLVIGSTYGAISGWVGGKVDSIMMRIVDILYAFPTMVLLILVKIVFDSVDLFEDPEMKALTGILSALSIVGWVTLARVVRGQVLQVKELTYVEAARAMGASSTWMVTRHVLPNIIGPVIIMLSFQIPANILYESFLSFIGLGLQPPYSSWGVLANEGYKSLRSSPHLMIAPSVIIYLVMLAFNLFGDGLRDAFDPKLKGKV